MSTLMLNGLNILVVEDDPLNAEALSELLKMLGAQEAHVQRNCGETLHYLRSNRPDIALLDYLLEGETAEAVIQDLRQRKLPYVVVTACAAQHLPAHLSPAHTISKPYMVNSLLIAVAAALDEVAAAQICAAQREKNLYAMKRIRDRAGDFVPLQRAFQ